MKRMIVALSAFLILTSKLSLSMGQDKPCNFLGKLDFKNGVDTITLEAKFTGLFKSSDYSVLKKLDKEKRLNYNEFGVDITEEDESSSISFIPKHCSENYSGTLSRKIFDTKFNKAAKIRLNHLIPNTIIYLKCITFNNVEDYINIPFFVIIDIQIKN